MCNKKTNSFLVKVEEPNYNIVVQVLNILATTTFNRLAVFQ